MQKDKQHAELYQQFNTVLFSVFSRIYSKLYYFNHSEQVLEYILKYLPVANPEIRHLMTLFLKEIFESDQPHFCALKRPRQVKNSGENVSVSKISHSVG